MEALVRQSIAEVNAKKKATVPWDFDEKWKQPVHVFAQGQWRGDLTASPPRARIGKLALYSWNIDFMLPFADSRMRKAVETLKQLVEHDAEKASTATVIFLQECVRSDLKLLASHPWVRETFALTDLDIDNWQSGHYGTVSLIDRRLQVASCYRVHYSQTNMERDVLFVDVLLREKVIRMGNTHLESLALEPPLRPAQMKLCSEHMHDSVVQGAIAAGDFNAIQDFDRTLHSSNGLKDAYLELGGSEEDAAGHTWGQQAATFLRNQFGTTRMDKVYFCGGLECSSFEKFGAGVEVEDQSERDSIIELGFDRPWVTDHLGVKSTFKISGDRPAL